MANTTTVQIVGSTSGGTTGATTISTALETNTNAHGGRQYYALSSGFNTITLPTAPVAPRAAVITPPAGNTVTLTLKGVTGDTGVPLHLTDAQKISFASGTTTFGITTNGTVTLEIQWL